VGRLSDGWSPSLRLLFALGSPWVLSAAGIGLLARERRSGAIAGAVALGLSVLVYYVVMAGIEHRVSWHYSAAMIAGWGSLAVAVGAMFGATGTTLGSRSPTAAALLGGVLAGEALLFLAHRNTDAVLLAQLGAGAALVLAGVLGERRIRPLAMAASIATAAFCIDAATRIVMRRYGWGG
jgi:hypothetical protein